MPKSVRDDAKLAREGFHNTYVANVAIPFGFHEISNASEWISCTQVRTFLDSFLLEIVSLLSTMGPLGPFIILSLVSHIHA